MPPVRAGTDAFVYLFALDGLHKIGSSGNPARRIADAAPGGTILHVIPSRNALQVERALQRRFVASQVHGEWFRLSEDDVALVCRLERVDAADDLPADLQPFPEAAARTLVQARVSPEMGEALELLVQQTRRKKNEELTIALENHLKAAGLWPPASEGSAGETPGKGE